VLEIEIPDNIVEVLTSGERMESGEPSLPVCYRTRTQVRGEWIRCL